MGQTYRNMRSDTHIRGSPVTVIPICTATPRALLGPLSSSPCTDNPAGPVDVHHQAGTYDRVEKVHHDIESYITLNTGDAQDLVTPDLSAGPDNCQLRLQKSRFLQLTVFQKTQVSVLVTVTKKNYK